MNVSTFLCRVSPLLFAILAFPAITRAEPATPIQVEQTGKLAEAYFAAHPEQIGETIATYLAEHPEFLVAAGESLRQRQQIAQQQAIVQNVVIHRDRLLAAGDPMSGLSKRKLSWFLSWTKSA